jgi:hypothetical protein
VLVLHGAVSFSGIEKLLGAEQGEYCAAVDFFYLGEPKAGHKPLDYER